jgi:hypothetical protein
MMRRLTTWQHSRACWYGYTLLVRVYTAGTGIHCWYGYASMLAVWNTRMRLLNQAYAAAYLPTSLQVTLMCLQI